MRPAFQPEGSSQPACFGVLDKDFVVAWDGAIPGAESSKAERTIRLRHGVRMVAPWGLGIKDNYPPGERLAVQAHLSLNLYQFGARATADPAESDCQSQP